MGAKGDVPPCCKTVFSKDEKVEVEKEFMESKKFTGLKNMNINILHHIKKTIVGFLNTGGGMFIIGIDEKNEQYTVVGMKMKESEM